MTFILSWHQIHNYRISLMNFLWLSHKCLVSNICCGSLPVTQSASCKWRDAQRAMRNRQFIGYTLGPLERNAMYRDDYLILGWGCYQILFGQILYFRHGFGREIYFHVAWARENLFSCKHGKPQSTDRVTTQQTHDAVKTLESGWILVGLVATKSDV